MSDVPTQDLLPLLEIAAEVAVQRSLLQTIVPVTRHGFVRAVNWTSWIHDVQMDGDADTIKAHDVTANGAFIGARVTVQFVPPHQAMIVSVARSQTGWQPWNCQWTCPGSAFQPILNDGTLTALAERSGQSCQINLALSFGPNTDGGRGGWQFSLPYIAAADTFEQEMLTKAATNAAGSEPHYVGWAFIAAGTQNLIPYLPKSALTSSLANVRNSDASGAAGTGIPQIPGILTFVNASNLVISGRYKVAS